MSISPVATLVGTENISIFRTNYTLYVLILHVGIEFHALNVLLPVMSVGNARKGLSVDDLF